MNPWQWLRKYFETSKSDLALREASAKAAAAAEVLRVDREVARVKAQANAREAAVVAGVQKLP